MSKSLVTQQEVNLTANELQTVGVFNPMASGTLSAFEQGQSVPLDEIATTWTPEVLGETKRLLFIGAGVELFYDEATGQNKPNAKAFFVELQKDANGLPYLKKVKMGTIEVVAQLADVQKANGVVSAAIAKPEMLNTMWDISYTGTRKSKTNALNKINTFRMQRVVIQAQ